MPDIHNQINYAVREPEPSDLGAIAGLRQTALDEDAGEDTRDMLSVFYQWKYFREGIQPACVRIAEDQGKLVGLVACTFKKLKIGNTMVLCGELGDLFTHPGYRRQG
ncbi:MAG: GNAT family N-acetyltransferase, partial [Planctomycetota bacterium]